jgi:hypothetical protein
MRYLPFALALALAACDPYADIRGEAVPQRDAAHLIVDESEGDAPLEAGRLAVSGSGPEWAMTLTTVDRTFSFTLVSPNNLDLASLDGRDGVTVGMNGQRAPVLQDAAGPLYVGYGGGQAIPEGLGDLAALGEVEGRHR